MQDMKYKALKQRFYSIIKQKILLDQTFGCVRVVYNRILDIRTKNFYDDKVKAMYCEIKSILVPVMCIFLVFGNSSTEDLS